MQRLIVGDWVRFHSKTRRRVMTGQIVNFLSGGRLLIICTTWDGRGHHWVKSIKKVWKVKDLCH